MHTRPTVPPPDQQLPATSLWRVRAVLADHPGALGTLTHACGEAGVNVLGLEVLPEVGGVTDDLVLAAPAGWGPADLARLVEGAGARATYVGPASGAALTDQVVRHLRAVAHLVDDPRSVTRVVADLLRARPAPAEGAGQGGTPRSPRRAGLHHLEMSVGGETMDLVREAPFTPGEQARADAIVALADRFADVASDRAATPGAPPPPGPSDLTVALDPAERAEPDQAAEAPVELRRHDDLVVAEVADLKVGEARIFASGAFWGVRVYVHPAWRRRGTGLRLLREIAAVAVAQGILELDVRLDAQDLAGLRLVLASGLCGSISCDGEETRTRLVLSRTAVQV